MDLNIGRVFSTAETDLEDALKAVAPEVKADALAIFNVAKTSLTNTFLTVAPTLEDDVTKAETAVEVALNALATSKLGTAGGALADEAADPIIQATGATIIAKVQAWVAANTTKK